MYPVVLLVLSLSQIHALRIPDPGSKSDEVYIRDFDASVDQYIRDFHALGGPRVTKTLSEDSHVPAGYWMATGVGILTTLVALVSMKFSNEESPLIGICAIVCYIALSCVIDISISAAGNGTGVKFEPACSVVIVEVGKLIVSMVLYTMNRLPKVRDGQPFLEENFRMKDVMLLAIPGGLFALNNICLYFALGRNDLATYGAFRDTLVIFNAVIWSIVFKSSLGMKRCIALAAMITGLFMNQIGPLLSSTFSFSVCLILIMTLINATATVANEYAIKQNTSIDLNMQNSTLYIFCSTCALIYLMMVHPEKMSSLDSFFANMHSMAWLIIGIQMTMGLVVSRMLRYADSVSKCVGACLRGPILTFAAPVIGLYSRLDFAVGFASILVASSACYFLVQGRPAPGAIEEKPEKQPLTK